jgi:hypothetical protein
MIIKIYTINISNFLNNIMIDCKEKTFKYYKKASILLFKNKIRIK